MASSISISYKKRLQSGADDFLFSRHGVLQCAEAGHFATPTAPRPASARDWPGSPPDKWDEAFRQGLRTPGYVDGRNILLEYRWAEGKQERLPALAQELVRLGVDVIVTISAPAIARPR